MAQLSYREAVSRGIAQEMARDERVMLIGEDIGGAGGVFKTTAGLYDKFGRTRVVDTPIAEIMFADFFAVCWDIVVNEIAKMRYMTNGQVKMPLVIKSGNGGSLRMGAQHSQSIENWAMAVPGLKVVTPSTPLDVVGLMAAAVRSDDPVLFFEHKGLYASKGEVPDGEIVDELGRAAIRRPGQDATVLALGLMVGRALDAADELAGEGIDVEVIDVRSLVPLDTQTLLTSISRTGRLFTVEENPRLLGWGAEIASIAADECFWDLDMPIRRITTPHIPLPSADSLEDAVLPSVDRIVQDVRKGVNL
jgi:pyruvate dehydrogenase E1 component beta subunit